MPPTPPISDNVYDVSNGCFAPKCDQSAPDHSTISTTDADDRRELQADEPLDDRQEPLVAAEPHHRERRDGVQQTPDRQRHRRKDGGGHERARRDQRARDEVAPDDEVDEERQDHCARQVIAPAFDERVAGGELPARGALGDRELDDDAGGQRPHEREPVFGAGDRGGHHVADTDAGGGEQEAWAEVGELHVKGKGRKHKASGKGSSPGLRRTSYLAPAPLPFDLCLCPLPFDLSTQFRL